MAGGAAVRFRKKEAKWRRVVEGQPGSGLSIRAYCAQQGVREHGFYWWRAQLARRDAADAKAAFVPVTVVAASTPASRINIFLPGDRRIQVVGSVDRTLLSDVLAMLERPAAATGQREAPQC